MEIRLENISGKKILENVTCRMDSSKINGIYHADLFLKTLVNPKLIEDGMIYIDDKVYKKRVPRLITIVDKRMPFYTSRVIDEILFCAKISGYKTKNMQEEITFLLKEFHLEESILKRIVHTLSETEKYFIKIISNLIYKPKIVVFNDVMNGMDYHNKKLIKQVINHLKEQGTLVILTSMDSNTLYELTEEVFIFNENSLLTCGDTNDIYSNIDILLENGIDVPYFSRLTYKANKEKNANLFYRKDVRDVIKDVYKSVS